MYSPDAPHRHMSGQRNGLLILCSPTSCMRTKALHGLSFRPPPLPTLRETAAGVRTADLIEQHHVCLELPENKKIIKAISFVQRLILDHVDKADLLTSRDIQINTLREGTQVCRMLAQSTHLARRVRSFDISNIYSNLRLNQLCLKPEMSTSFQNIIFLRSLPLQTPDVLSSWSRSPVPLYYKNPVNES